MLSGIVGTGIVTVDKIADDIVVDKRRVKSQDVVR